MATLIDLLSFILSAQTYDGITETCANNGALCPAESFTALGAAYATQGYYAQADILFYLTHSSMANLAPLLYLIAAAGGLTALALGAPPKMYLWFFIGPGIYHWLLETRLPAHGVQWSIAGKAEDQREVWRLAEVGLLNMPIIDRVKSTDKLDYEGSDIAPSGCRPALDPVYVSYFFLYYDELVSSVVQNVVKWTGVFRQRQAIATEGSTTSINSTSAPGLTTPDTKEDGSDRWYLLANKKWGMLDTITSARVSNPDVRDLLSTFLSSECGDALMNTVDKRNYAAAANNKSGRLPCSLILSSSSSSQDGQLCDEIQTGKSTIQDSNYERLLREMQKTTLPIPVSARRLINDTTSTGSFYTFLNGFAPMLNNTSVANYLTTQNEISCPSLFYLVVEAFRWEAGHVYHQLVSRAPRSMTTETFLFNLFYGWNIRNATGAGSQLLKGDEIRKWATNLILVHLLKNEMAMTKRVADPRLSNERQLQTYSDNSIGQTGGKTKYSEIYSWARMIPYIQGIFLYILAMGYPFACVLIVMPGWHKSLFTWMSFWLWVKLWDVGFALVLVMERSIWSTIGNNSTIGNLSPLINGMQQWGDVKAYCLQNTSQVAAAAQNMCSSIMAGGLCAVPSISEGGSSTMDSIPWWQAAAIFDRAMLVGSAIDLDVSNGYYIYIMSALYFAVPAVTGQLVLGAKAGMASFVGNITDGAKGDASGAAKSGFTGDLRNKGASASEAVRQEAQMKAFRKGGLAQRALESSNQAMDAGLSHSFAGAQATGIGQINSMLGLSQGNRKSSLAAGSAFLGMTATARGNSVLMGMGAVEAGRMQTNPDGSLKLGADGKPMKMSPKQQVAEAAAHINDPEYWKKRTGELVKAGGYDPRGGTSSGGGSMAPAPAFLSGVGGVSVAGRSVGSSGGMAMGGGFGGAPGFAGGGTMGGGSGMPPAGGLSDSAKLGMAGGIMSKIPFANKLNPLDAQQVGTALNSFGGYAIDRRFNDMNAGNSMRSAEVQAAGFGFQAQQGQLSEYNRRVGAQAEFAAQNDSWYDRRDLSESASGYISSLGGDSSYLAPGSKPADMMGASMSGQLGAQAYAAASYANTGGAYSQRVSDASSFIQSNYGGSALGAYYDNSTSPAGETFRAWNAAASFTTATLSEQSAGGSSIGETVKGGTISIPGENAGDKVTELTFPE